MRSSPRNRGFLDPGHPSGSQSRETLKQGRAAGEIGVMSSVPSSTSAAIAWTTYQSFSTKASSTASAPATRPSVSASGTFENDIFAIVADSTADPILHGQRPARLDLGRTPTLISLVETRCLDGFAEASRSFRHGITAEGFLIRIAMGTAGATRSASASSGVVERP